MRRSPGPRWLVAIIVVATATAAVLAWAANRPDVPPRWARALAAARPDGERWLVAVMVDRWDGRVITKITLGDTTWSGRWSATDGADARILAWAGKGPPAGSPCVLGYDGSPPETLVVEDCSVGVSPLVHRVVTGDGATFRVEAAGTELVGRILAPSPSAWRIVSTRIPTIGRQRRWHLEVARPAEEVDGEVRDWVVLLESSGDVGWCVLQEDRRATRLMDGRKAVWNWGVQGRSSGSVRPLRLRWNKEWGTTAWHVENESGQKVAWARVGEAMADDGKTLHGEVLWDDAVPGDERGWVIGRSPGGIIVARIPWVARIE